MSSAFYQQLADQARTVEGRRQFALLAYNGLLAADQAQAASVYAVQLLDSGSFQDYCPNGLQVEGRNEIRLIVSGVTASQALVDAAVEAGADLLLVHHDYFWRGEAAQVVGIKHRRLKALLQHDINLMAYHLPLDVHAELGNNAHFFKQKTAYEMIW